MCECEADFKPSTVNTTDDCVPCSTIYDYCCNDPITPPPTPCTVNCVNPDVPTNVQD